MLRVGFSLLLGLAAMFEVAEGGARAAPPTLAGFMPSRGGDAQRVRVERLGRALGLVAAAPSFALAEIVGRAEALAAGGRLDEAAALFDVAVDEGTRAPLQISDPPALVRAAVARVTIGLARGERDHAEDLLARLLRYDPTFELSSREDTPRVRAAVERARRRLGAAPALERADLGERCADQTLLVARRLDAGTIEYARYAGCRLVASVRAGDDTAESTLVTALGGPRPAPSPPPIAVSPVARAPRSQGTTPIYRRAWFWGVTLGVAAALTGAGIWAATSGSAASDDRWHVTPRF